MNRGALMGLILAASSVVSACATQVKADANIPLRVERIQHACRDIMELTPGETLYENCVLSLRQTMASVDAAAALQEQRETCFGRGLQPGTVDFARCVVKSSAQ